MISYDNLNTLQLDTLKEVGNIGAGNACTALSGLLGTQVDMLVPQVHLLTPGSTVDYLGGGDNVVCGVRIDVKADLTGMMFHIISRRFSERLINTFYPKQLEDLTQIDEMDASVLCEMGNITSGAYASALASLTDLVVDIGTPTQHVLSISEILKIPMEAYNEESKGILVIDEQFIIDDEHISSNMILVLENNSLNKLFERLGVENNECKD